MLNSYNHIQSAHCENGVTVNLLRANGIDFIDEPMAFGIGSGLFYIHLPFFKFNNGPAISFRTMPGRIFKQTCKYLDVDYQSKKFRNPIIAKEYLDKLLMQNIKVGCQVGVFNLSYLPVEYRFHFNAHNIVIYGKENGLYKVSDSVMEATTEVDEAELSKVRFAKGLYSPKGHLYYVVRTGKVDDAIIRRAIIKGIKRNVRDMLYIPGNFAGVGGIKYTGNQIQKWRDKYGIRKAGQYLGQIVRMQEEIGTGGGGFRFIYAAFLQKAAGYFDSEDFASISDEFTKAGDTWRSAAISMAAVYRGIKTDQSHFNEIKDTLHEIYSIEKKAFKNLSRLKLKKL